YTVATTSGAYAEKALCDVKTVHPLPDRVTFAQGAAVGVPYGTAYRGLFNRAQGRAGETLLVHGASGGVGTAAVQLARAAGLTGNRGEVTINPRDAMSRDADIRCMTLMNATDAELAGIHAALGAGLENGTLRPVIREEIPLADAPRAHREVLEPGAYGKIVLVP